MEHTHTNTHLHLIGQIDSQMDPVVELADERVGWRM